MTGHASHPFHCDPRGVADEGDELSIQRRLLKAVKGTGIFAAAVPNGGKRTAWERIRAHQEGMVAGFPDLIVYWRGGCAFMEMKAKAGVLSDAQIACLQNLHNAGHHVGVFRSVASAVSFLERCGAPVRISA